MSSTEEKDDREKIMAHRAFNQKKASALPLGGITPPFGTYDHQRHLVESLQYSQTEATNHQTKQTNALCI